MAFVLVVFGVSWAGLEEGCRVLPGPDGLSRACKSRSAELPLRLGFSELGYHTC